MSVRFFSRLVSLLLRVTARAIRILPGFAAHRLGQAMGLLGFAIGRKHRRLALHNLRLAYGEEKTEAERRTIALKSFMNMGQNFIDFCRMQSLLRKDPRSFIEMEGFDNIEKALAQGKGAILLTGHLGSWELMAAAYAHLGLPVTAIVSSIGDPAVDQFMNTMRESCGYETLPKRDATQGVASRLRQNILVGILADQSPRNDGVPVEFFGRTAGATRGPAVFALRSGSPVIPAFAIRLEDPTKHKFIVEKPLELIRTGDISEDIARNTQLFQSVIERYVRRYPEQWLWMQKRWKIRSYLKRKLEKSQCHEGPPSTGGRQDSLSGGARPTRRPC